MSAVISLYEEKPIHCNLWTEMVLMALIIGGTFIFYLPPMVYRNGSMPSYDYFQFRFVEWVAIVLSLILGGLWPAMIRLVQWIPDIINVRGTSGVSYNRTFLYLGFERNEISSRGQDTH